ncbi:hypothetical protein NHP190003_03390 [Helicobacter sp. NHP19-003]|uniref:Uncharacterized protein n=1 Tax=Helicobacter gastrocanis TaxID=2849641 RepID=A0ABM7S9J9_9HELI|nr:hypothetical protein [Helicobacter sp. NHP19-003]BCZ17057.1 hypothetical protein NHP190003_03390 [Helicobacter sp. NHP19-003]
MAANYGAIRFFLATIVEVKKSSVKVRYNNTTSDFVPYTQVHNQFKTSYSPPTVGETVLYLKMGHFGLVLGTSILPQEVEDDQDEKVQKIKYKDGTTITYSDGVLKVESLKDLIVECQTATLKAQKIVKVECQEASVKAQNALNLEAQTAKIKANSVVVDAPDVTLGGSMATPLDGVVTGQCTCSFTGAPHPMFSSKVKAVK